MENIRLNQRNVVLLSLFDTINHQTFQGGRNRHWQVVTQNGVEFITPQSFCWLYCWAKTGMNSINAKSLAKQVFNAAFSFSFSEVDNEHLFELARRLRYIETPTPEELNELIQYLPLN
jgi:hypothetical protein